jgi:ribA/ribD-fused uncharacterized protein
MWQTVFNCTEQCYFTAKADYLEDPKRKEEIMREDDPVKILHAGKRVVNNANKNWADVEQEVMLKVNREKYAQNYGVRAALMATQGTKLAEANPHCTHWGIGVSILSEEREKSPTWGKNLMGEILMKIRDEIANTTHEKMVLK